MAASSHRNIFNTSNLGQRNERTYINVTPAAYVSRQGGVIRNPTSSQLPKCSTPTIPLVPKSQNVKKVQEPSYSTILQLQREFSRERSQPVQSSSNNYADGAIYANFSTYSVSNYSELEALRSSDSQGSTEEEIGALTYTSPPSPVSSSYSELRQATRNPPGYPQFQNYVPAPSMNNVQGGNYESLYEPIQTNSGGNGVRRNYFNTYRSNISHQSSSSSDSDYFGPCSKCSEKIIGEGTGCTAMGRLYHIACFTCNSCNCNLQGKPFYALDGKPYCQTDYMNTLEKCCKCLQPILDRILRATGKPYHPQCFTCVVCSKSLDGVPFTVDSRNQIHCIEDFHKRFAPRCSVCRNPIMPEAGQEETVRVVALDRSFHVNCYRCEDCQLLLSSETEGRGCYPLDDHVYCKNCNTKRIQVLTYGIGRE